METRVARYQGLQRKPLIGMGAVLGHIGSPPAITRSLSRNDFDEKAFDLRSICKFESADR
jgi:hypothetical protein